MRAHVEKELEELRKARPGGNPGGEQRTTVNEMVNNTTNTYTSPPGGMENVFSRWRRAPEGGDSEGKKKKMDKDERKSLDATARMFFWIAVLLSYDFIITALASLFNYLGMPFLSQLTAGVSLFEPYAGFLLPTDITTYGSWLIFTLASPFFISVFATRAMTSFFFQHKVKLLLLAVYIFMIHGVSLIGKSWYEVSGVIGQNWVILLVVVIVAYFIGRKITPSVQGITMDDVGYLLFSMVASFLFLNYNFWIGSPKAIIHLFFAIAFGYLVMRKYEETEFSFYLWMTALVIADFFGYTLAKWLGMTVGNFFPVLLALVALYIAYRATEARFVTVFAVAICIISILANVADASQIRSGIAEPGAAKIETGAVQNAWGSLWSWVTGRVDLATRQFSGQVEQNQYESLGVYFSNLKPAQPRFYTDEPVVIWGSIRSKTYQDAVIVNPSCYVSKAGSFLFSGTKSTGKMIPGQPFPIFQLEDTDIECSFPRNTFDAGTQTVTFSAQYNFVTNAYQKAYFMDLERYRAYVRQSIDPLTQLGIKDKTPKAVFTNGPVEVGMGVQPLTPVSDPNSYTVLPAISLTLSNRKQIEDKDKKIITRWEGKIQNIRELILLMPPGVIIPDPKSCTPAPFKAYTEADCRNACGGAGMAGAGPGEGINENDDYSTCVRSCKDKNACKTECARILQKCNDDCGFLFRGDNDQVTYTAYALDVAAIQLKDEYKDIDKFKTFQCRMQPSPTVLDNTPLTTRYFRVRAKYDYLLENSVQAVVEKSPIQAVASSQGTVLPLGPNTGRFEASVAALAPMLNSPDIAAGVGEREYDPYVRAAAEREGADYLLLKAVIQKASNWDPSAQNYDPTPEGGDYRVGLAGIPVSVARKQGCVPEDLDQALARDVLKDSQKNIDCAAKYLKHLLGTQEKGNVQKGIRNLAGGYYSGESAMENSEPVPVSTTTVTLTKIVPKWENDKNLGYAGTRAYVNSVIDSYNQLRQQLPATAAPGTTPGSSSETTFKASYSQGSGQVTLSWDTTAGLKMPGAVGYYIARYKNGANGGNVCQDATTAASPSSSCTDILPDQTSGTTYSYELIVYGFDDQGGVTIIIKKQASATVSTQTSGQTAIA